ncbi:carbohydrate ABC transporter permease [Candidatus Roseilinea sp. NK_OTU-006]|jgi:multiple sugar transport system permease protein|uniref:carbohydrate ABC transporter permease n=1 Tax=Candidatus Roseilinea sp. NK_OTU-006 TaxID=2704250 RepID=UPI00145F93A7|nr:carbohydrate ABC transporter permease [Candidatus Roseilinea sp. NK_OTU-006]
MFARLPSPREHALRKQVEPWLINSAVIVIVALLLLPIALTLSTSFKREQDVLRRPPVLLPCDDPQGHFRLSACRFVVEGYERVIAPRPDPNALLGVRLTGRMFSTYLPNTVLYALLSSGLVFVLAGFAGYAFSRYRFRGRRALMVAILAITGIPLLTNLLALYQMAVDLRKSGLPGYDERMFIIAVYVGFYLPISVWIVKGFFDTIPRELEEAALIDGCTPIGVLWRIVVPLAMPGLLAAFLLCFVNVWNEFIAGYLLITKRDLRTAMFGMYDFLSQNIINYQVIAAACVLIAAPVVILFLFTRQTFFQAMTEGAVKG